MMTMGGLMTVIIAIGTVTLVTLTLILVIIEIVRR